MDQSSSRTRARMPAQPAEQASSAFLPQYGFGKTYTFDELVDQHPFLYRVHTPHRRRDKTSRATSPNPSRPTSPFKPQLPRAPSLSASVSSIRTGNVLSSSIDEDDDDAAPSDPYFISRRFRDDLSSPDVHVRRRTLSTLSSLSGGGSDVGTYIGSDYEYDFSDAESDVATAVSSSGLARSPSLIVGGRRRMNSLTPSRPGSRRSTSLGHVSFSLDGKATNPPRPMTPMSMSNASENIDQLGRPVDMTYADLQRHLDWTTRSQSPYVTTSFSFFWALWEAVRRYRLGVKHDVEIAVVDARRLRGKARTALEVLRGVEEAQQDKTYWKWYRFALDAQDVLVFGAIPGDAIYASTPLTHILANLPAYCFRSTAEVTKSLGLAGGDGDDDDIKDDIDPRSPTAHQVQTIFFPVTTPDRKSLSGSIISNTPSKEKERDRARASELITSLAWDVGTTLKPLRKPHASRSLSSSTSSAPKTQTQQQQQQRFTSHRAFCHALEAAFLSPARSEQARISDATTGAVRLASLLILPWLRATCAEGVGLFGDYESEDEDDNSSSDEDAPSHMHDSECLGLAGDGCALESMHSSTSSASKAEKTKTRPLSRRALAMRDAEEVLEELAAALARWPAGWWASAPSSGYDHEKVGKTAATATATEEIERLRAESVHTCVEEIASGVRARGGWALAGELGKIVRGESMNLDEDRRGRERGKSRSRSRSRSRIGNYEKRDAESLPAGVEAGGGEEQGRATKPWPLRRASSSSPSPYKPRARSPLGLAPAVLGPAIVMKDGQNNQENVNARGHGQRLGKTASEPGAKMGEWESSEEDLDLLLSSSLTGRMARLGPSPGTLGSTQVQDERRESEKDESHDGGSRPGNWELNTPPPTPPPAPSRSTVGVEAESSGGNLLERRASSPPPPPPRSTRRRQSSTTSGTPGTPGTPGSLPGEWPGEGVLIGEAQLQAQMQVLPQTPQRPRPFSWSGALSSSPLGGVSRTPSDENLRNTSATRGDARAALLGEVLQAALGLGVSISTGAEGAGAGAGSRPRTPGSGSGSGTESPGRPMHHRRHSSQLTMQLEQELSPVREDAEGEGEDALEAALEKLQLQQLEGSKESVSDVAEAAEGKEVRDCENGDRSSSTLDQLLAPAAPPAIVVRERSSTLESIQEEEWSIIDVPAEYVPTLENGNGDAEKRDRKESSNAEIDEEIMRAQALCSSSSSSDPVTVPLPLSTVNSSIAEARDQDQEVVKEEREQEVKENETLMYTEKVIVLTPLSSPRALLTTIPLPSSSSSNHESAPSPPTAPTPSHISLWKRPLIRILQLLGFELTSSSPAAAATASSPVFEDPCARADVVFEQYAQVHSKSWAMSCFVVGIMASLLVSSAQRREIMFYNTLT